MAEDEVTDGEEEDQYDPDSPAVYLEWLPDDDLEAGEGRDVAVYRSSAVGGCVGALVRHRLGQEPEPFPQMMLDAFAEGHAAEQQILGMLRDKGWKVLDDWTVESYPWFKGWFNGQPRAEVKVGKSAVIRTHLDGVVECYMADVKEKYKVGQRAVVEVKALSEEVAANFRRHQFGAFPYYGVQTDVQRYSTDLPILFVVGVKKKVNKQADDYDPEDVEIQDIEIYWFPDGYESLGQLKVRVMNVEKAVRNIEEGYGEIPACDYKMYPCGFYPDHDETSETSIWFKGKPKEAAELGFQEDVIDTLWEEYAAGKKMENDGEKKRKAAAAGLKAAFDGADEKGGTIRTQRYEIEDYVESELRGRDPDYKKMFEKLAKEAEMDTDDVAAMCDEFRKEGWEMRYPKAKPIKKEEKEEEES